MRLTCTINGEPREVDGVWEGESLLYVLRERLALPGSKNACEQGECGSCSVYLDGELVGAAASPIDDVRGSAAYRRHALTVLARRTLDWAWSEQCG